LNSPYWTMPHAALAAPTVMTTCSTVIARVPRPNW
jgi:hypothetical protein